MALRISNFAVGTSRANAARQLGRMHFMKAHCSLNPCYHSCSRRQSVSLQKAPSLWSCKTRPSALASQERSISLSNPPMPKIVTMYDEMVARGEVQVDEEQRSLLGALSELHRILERKSYSSHRKDALERWLPPGASAVSCEIFHELSCN